MNMKLILALPLVFASAAQAAPANWKPMLSDDKKCTAMVPGNWEKTVTRVGMQVPAGRSHAIATLEEGTMADYKGLLHTMYKVTKTMEDSASRYWVETAGAKGNNMREWHIAVPGSGGVCTVFIGFDNTLSEADAKTIATSLKKH